MEEKPLNGVSVVEFGELLPGRSAAMILADLGANVIHVMSDDNEKSDSVSAVVNRNKSCVRLDNNKKTKTNQLLSLLQLADIVIDSSKNGAKEALDVNFDYEDLRRDRPELIVVLVTGFASNDPLRCDWKATEPVILAAAGAFTDMGFNRILMGLNPCFSPLPLASSYTTSLVACSAVLGLIGKQRFGTGDEVEVPMIAATMEGLSYNSYVVEDLPTRYMCMREQEIVRRRKEGIPLDMKYEDLQEFLDPFYRTYRCKDGRFFYVVCPSHENHVKRCLKVCGLYEEMVQLGLPDLPDLHLNSKEMGGNASMGMYPLPKEWAGKVSERMKEVFLTKTSTEWNQIFGETKIPGQSHNTFQEWVLSNHCNDSGLIVTVKKDPFFGDMKQPGPFVWLEDVAEKLLETIKPRQFVSFLEAKNLLTQSKTAKKVVESPMKRQKLSHPGEKHEWLEDFHVLDLTNVIAGPHCSAFLGRFGAKVTKLEPVKTFYDPLIGTLFAFQTDMGKRSILVDIKKEKGKKIFDELIKSVHIVIINAIENQLDNLHLTAAKLKEINPNILFCRVDCFGGPLKEKGGKTNYVGYDDVIQANSGIMSRFGGFETPEEHAHLGTLDVNCGFLAALSVLLTYYRHLKTGLIGRGRTSLAAASNLAQISFCFDYKGRPGFNEPSGREVMGFNGLSHFYRTADDWVYLDVSMEELKVLNKIPLFCGIIKLKSEEYKNFFTKVFEKKTSEEWVSELHKHNIAIIQPQYIADIRAKNSRIADGTVGTNLGSYAFSIHEDHPSGHKLTQIDHFAIRPKEAKIRAVLPTMKHGGATLEVLKGLGYKQEEIDGLLRDKVVSCEWGREFLPS